MDNNGNPVSGNIDIRYRSLKNSSDIFLSGIPMHFDSLGARYHFTSNQLIEIYAEKDGRELRIDPKKEISIEFPTSGKKKEKPEEMDLFRLNIKNKKWDYRGKTNASFENVKPNVQGKEEAVQNIENQYSNLENDLIQNYQEKIRTLESSVQYPSQPIMPERYDEERPVFDFDLDADAIPELAEYSNISWQPEGNENALRLISTVEWETDEISINKISGNNYKMTFNNGQYNVELNVKPVLTPKEYNRALAIHNSKMTAYKAAKASADAQIKSEKDKLIGEQEKKMEELEEKKSKQIEAILDSPEKNQDIVEKAVINVFTIKELGVWNCDFLFAPHDVESNIVLEDSKGKRYSNTTVYLADLNKNTLTKFYLDDFVRIKFNPKSNNQLWILCPDGKIAIAYPEKIKAINPKNKKNIITLEKINKEIQGVNDVYDILKIGKSM